jgi:hypothetical protein
MAPDAGIQSGFRAGGRQNHVECGEAFYSVTLSIVTDGEEKWLLCPDHRPHFFHRLRRPHFAPRDRSASFAVLVGT